MAYEDYPGNSFADREKKKTDEKHVTTAVVSNAKTKKKSEVRKIREAFISDSAGDIKSYILEDVLIPAAKKAISDVVTNGIDMLLYGEAGRTKKRTISDSVSYRQYYDNNRRDDRRSEKLGVYDYDDVTVDSKSEAEEVINSLEDIIDTYGHATVEDLYDLVGISSHYTSQYYGWKNLRNADSVRLRDGRYLIRLPRAIPLNLK